MKQSILRTKRVPKAERKSLFSTRQDDRGQLYMICQNSIPNGKYWHGSECFRYSKVGTEAVSVLCWYCTERMTEPPVINRSNVNTGKPRGWKLKSVFVDKDGTVYHKGIEQPNLKGTLPVTEIKEVKTKKKIKLTKKQRLERTHELGDEVAKLKAELFRETRKTKKAIIVAEISKLNRELKKLL